MHSHALLFASQVAMTFNVGLFCAVIMGYVLGIMFFSHATDNFAAYLAAAKRAHANDRAAPYKMDPELGTAGKCEGCEGCDGCDPAYQSRADVSGGGGLAGVMLGAGGKGAISTPVSPKSGNARNSSVPDEDIGVMPSCCPEPR